MNLSLPCITGSLETLQIFMEINLSPFGKGRVSNRISNIISPETKKENISVFGFAFELLEKKRITFRSPHNP